MSQEVDPRFVEVDGVWRQRISAGQVWMTRTKRTISILRLASNHNQPKDVKDGTRRWRVMDAYPLPGYREGRDLPEAMIWDRYTLV